MAGPPVQYVTTRDGMSIAYAVSGAGPTFVFTPPAFSHIQLFWNEDTFLRPWLEGLASRFRLVQFDGRGKGMSTRGLPGEIGLTDLQEDLIAVVDHLQLDEFVLMASTPLMCQMTIRYALDNRQRVRGLVFASPTGDGTSVPRALVGSFAEHDWDSFLRSMAGLVRASDLDDNAEQMKQAMTQADWLTYVRAAQAVDLAPDLPKLTTPALVLHPRDYLLPVHVSMKVAAAMLDARLVVIDGTNTLGDPVQGLKAIEDFLAGVPGREQVAAVSGPSIVSEPTTVLSKREAEVLRLIAAGKSNREIADAVVISIRTVERHIANLYGKTGSRTKAQATAYAHRHGLT